MTDIRLMKIMLRISGFGTTHYFRHCDIDSADSRAQVIAALSTPETPSRDIANLGTVYSYLDSASPTPEFWAKHGTSPLPTPAGMPTSGASTVVVPYGGCAARHAALGRAGTYIGPELPSIWPIVSPGMTVKQFAEVYYGTSTSVRSQSGNITIPGSPPITITTAAFADVLESMGR